MQTGNNANATIPFESTSRSELIQCAFDVVWFFLFAVQTQSMRIQCAVRTGLMMSLYNFCSLLTDEVAREVLTSDKLSEVLLSLNGHEDSSIREKSTEISLVWT